MLRGQARQAPEQRRRMVLLWLSALAAAVSFMRLWVLMWVLINCASVVRAEARPGFPRAVSGSQAHQISLPVVAGLHFGHNQRARAANRADRTLREKLPGSTWHTLACLWMMNCAAYVCARVCVCVSECVRTRLDDCRLFGNLVLTSHQLPRLGTPRIWTRPPLATFQRSSGATWTQTPRRLTSSQMRSSAFLCPPPVHSLHDSALPDADSFICAQALPPNADDETKSIKNSLSSGTKRGGVP